jgi:type II secretory pathway pseudopilin PulG
VRSNNMHRTFGISKSRARGFAVIEALIAFLVVAFGMMALGSFQFTLSRASDVAKQRSEATRIAQGEIDRLRSFGQKTADLNRGDDRFTFAEEVEVTPLNTPTVRTESSPLTNTDYRIASTVSAPTAPLPALGERFRWIDIAVTWLDRTGGAQRIALSSAISDGAPGELGASTTGRSGVPGTLRPKNRNINIPYPAVNLANCPTGTAACSGFIPPPGNRLFVFNNETGNVQRFCVDPNNATIVVSENMSTSALTCTDYLSVYGVEAYILSGYIRFKTGGNSQLPTRLNIADPLGFNDATRALIATDLTQAASVTTSPMLITSSGTGYAPQAYECYAQRQVTVRRNSNAVAGQTDILSIPDLGSATAASVPAGYANNNLANDPRHIAYMCIVVPMDHDSNSTTAAVWSGEVTFNPRGGWVFSTTGGGRTLGQPTNDIGEATGKARLCRFTSDYNSNNEISNGEHPRRYRGATGALDNQNYLVIDGEDDCPGDDAITPTANNPTADDYIDTNTVEHQPSPELSFRCATISGNNTVRCATNDRTWLREAALPTTPTPLPGIPME